VKEYIMEKILRMLVEGNIRYMNGRPNEKNLPYQRHETTEEQHPFAVVLTCSDSRVSPELIFDQGIGDLFVIRTAGHVVDEAAMGSIQYAVEHLHVDTIVVLGHEKCGAVTAAVNESEEDGSIAYIVEAIQPAVEVAKKMRIGDEVINAIKINTVQVAQKLKRDPILVRAMIIPALYQLASGRVELI
jgi:carbonic anhydrase